MTVAFVPAAASCRFLVPLAASLALTCVGARAADPAPAPAPPAAAAPAAEPTHAPEPNVQHIVNEDDGARIEELRVRGRTRSIHVQPKTPGAPAYEVLPGDGVPDAGGSADGRRSGGERVWNVLKF